MQTIAHNTKQYSKTFSMAALFSVLVFVGLYLYFVHETVQNVVARATAERSIARIGGELSSLESAYVEAKGAITIDRAHASGFSDISNADFVSRKAIGQLSLGQKEI